MSNRDFDRENDRRERTRSSFFDNLDDPFNRPSEPAPDRGGFQPVRRPYPERQPINDFPRYQQQREETPSYSDYQGNGNVTIYSPKSYADVQDMIDNLKRNESIIVNLEGIESASAQRILDFLSGAAYALGGSMRRVKEMHSTFLITPQGTGITDTNDDRNYR